MIHSNVSEYFDLKVAKYGKSHRSVGYFSEFTQQLRFLVLASGLNWEPMDTVLDVGCGLGDLVGFCQKEGYLCKYRGIDVSPQMIMLAKDTFGDGLFEVGDFMAEGYQLRVDFTVGSGVANVEVPNAIVEAKRLIEKGNLVSRKGCAFNFLSTLTPGADRKSQMTYFDPIEMATFCFTLTPNVVLKHDYLPNDFTVFLMK